MYNPTFPSILEVPKFALTYKMLKSCADNGIDYLGGTEGGPFMRFRTTGHHRRQCTFYMQLGDEKHKGEDPKYVYVLYHEEPNKYVARLRVEKDLDEEIQRRSIFFTISQGNGEDVHPSEFLLGKSLVNGLILVFVDGTKKTSSGGGGDDGEKEPIINDGEGEEEPVGEQESDAQVISFQEYRKRRVA